MHALPSDVGYHPENHGEEDASTLRRRARKTMIVGRVIGWIFVGAAIASLGWDFYVWASTGILSLSAAGELWFMLDKDSLLIAEPAISRHIPFIGPWLWHPVISTVLTWPAVLVFLVPGLVLVGIFHRPRRIRRKEK